MMGRRVGRRVSCHSLFPPPTLRLVTNFSIAIESRVARIKARVAELTGNMEAQ